MKRKLAVAVIGGALGGIALVGCIAAVTSPEDTATPTPTEPPTIVVEATGVPSPTESPLSLPPCPTEDSDGCYWDADTMGNGTGDDIVTYPTEGMPDDFDPDTDSTAPIEAPYEGQWDTVPDYVLACGPDAAPAIDYNPVWGYWAYCEGALVNDDGTLWEGGK